MVRTKTLTYIAYSFDVQFKRPTDIAQALAGVNARMTPPLPSLGLQDSVFEVNNNFTGFKVFRAVPKDKVTGKHSTLIEK